MNKLKSTLCSFQGELLIPINYQTTPNGRVEIIPPEGTMYIVACIDKTSIHIPAVEFTIKKTDFIEKVKPKKSTDPIMVCIAYFIQQNPELYKACKLKRLFYDDSKYKKFKSLNTDIRAEHRRENIFIIHVLTKKKDWKNLREFRATTQTFYKGRANHNKN